MRPLHERWRPPRPAAGAALLKLGATQEGILRADTLTWTGRMRDTVVFSVLADKWPAVRDRLDVRLRETTAQI